MDMQTILQVSIFKNTVSEYLQAFIIFAGLIVALNIGKFILVKYLGKLAAKTTTDMDDFLVSLISSIGFPVFITVALYFSVLSLNTPESLRFLIRGLMVTVVTIRVILLSQEALKYGIKKFYMRRFQQDNPSTELVVNSITGVLKWVIWVLGIIFLLDNLGVNISTFVAGIGIGGVAVALASQAVLGDAFSAFSIFLDKPFEIGDFVIIDDLRGTVEHIGVKTTRIRSLGGEQLIFSNSDLTKSRIKNYKRMQTRRIVFNFGVVYGLSVEQVKRIPMIVKEILDGMKDVRLDRVHFQSFGNFSLIFEVVYYVNSPDYNVYMDKQQEINWGLMEELKKENIEFAYPTQTLHVVKDQKIL